MNPNENSVAPGWLLRLYLNPLSTKSQILKSAQLPSACLFSASLLSWHDWFCKGSLLIWILSEKGRSKASPWLNGTTYCWYEHEGVEETAPELSQLFFTDFRVYHDSVQYQYTGISKALGWLYKCDVPVTRHTWAGLKSSVIQPSRRSLCIEQNCSKPIESEEITPKAGDSSNLVKGLQNEADFLWKKCWHLLGKTYFFVKP